MTQLPTGVEGKAVRLGDLSEPSRLADDCSMQHVGLIFLIFL